MRITVRFPCAAKDLSQLDKGLAQAKCQALVLLISTRDSVWAEYQNLKGWCFYV